MKNMRLVEINTNTAIQTVSFILDDKIKIENKDKNLITVNFDNGCIELSFDDRSDIDDIKEIKLRLEQLIKIEDVFLTSLYYEDIDKYSIEDYSFLSYVKHELENQGDDISNYNKDVTIVDFGCGVTVLPGFVYITIKLK